MFKDILAALGLASLVSPQRESDYLRERNRIFDEADEEVRRYREEEKRYKEEVDINEDYIKSKRTQTPMHTLYINIYEIGKTKVRIKITNHKDMKSTLSIPHEGLMQALEDVGKLREYYEKRSFVVETQVDLLE